MPAAAKKTIATELQITISSTLTEIPFLDNIEVDPGENKVHNLLGVNMPYETPIATGVRGVGSLSADVLAYDPTDSVHQKVAQAFNDQTEVVGAYKLGGTGKTISVKYIITKFPINTKAAAVLAGKLEAVITELIDLPES
jgi:uncharacterized FAD-dependent dehydrogenase